MGKQIKSKKTSIITSNFKHLRKMRGLSQAQLGEIFSKSEHYISYIELGKRKIEAEFLFSFCQWAEISMTRIMTEDLSGLNHKEIYAPKKSVPSLNEPSAPYEIDEKTLGELIVLKFQELESRIDDLEK